MRSETQGETNQSIEWEAFPAEKPTYTLNYISVFWNILEVPHALTDRKRCSATFFYVVKLA